MKKHLLFLFAALLPLVASAQTKVEIDGIWYNLVSKAKQAEVTSPDGAKYSGSITIPATVTHNGVAHSVRSIGEEAFSYCSSLTDIILPEGVTSISNRAFSYCSSLTDIILPEGVTSIGHQAFVDCRSLTAITIPESVTSIGSSAFHWCRGLTAINIPEGVTSIEHYTFQECSSLTAITIPEGVTSIGSQAFQDCSSLTDITLPKSVSRIYSNAFAGCYELTDVYCYAETVPGTDANAFNGSYIEYATLHVPAGAINSYKATAPWSRFGTIKTIENVTLEKCATPVISYIDGEIVLTCSTEGAEIKTNVTTENGNEFTGTRFEFIPTHTFTAYATKEKYEDSDEVTLTICWIPCSEAHESEETSILTIPSKPVLISARDGVITFSGLAEGTEVTLYTTDGAKVAQQQSSAGEATFTVDTNQVYLVHIGDKVVKIGM